MKHSSDLLFCRRQIDVMAKFQQCGGVFHAGLIRIHLPGMKIEAVRAVRLQYFSNAVFKDRIREQSEVTPAAPRENDRLTVEGGR